VGEALSALPPDSIDCGVILYRAIWRNDWFDPDYRGAVKPEAFFRRPPTTKSDGTHDPGDSDGLSLRIAASCTPDEFADTFNRCYGIATLHAGRLLDLGLTFVRDPEDANEVLVQGVPFVNEGTAEAEKLAGDVARSARVACRYIPARKREPRR